MSVNITKEDNLVKVSRSTHTNTYAENPQGTGHDLIDAKNTDLIVIFKDSSREYPDGKVVKSDTIGTRFDYDYKRNQQGNIIYCIVTETKYSTVFLKDIEKVSKKIYYDENGRIIETDYYDRDGVTYFRVRFKYHDNGNLAEKEEKNLQTIETSEYDTLGKLVRVMVKTIKSGAVYKKYFCEYFEDSTKPKHYIDWDKDAEVFIELDKNSEGKILSETAITRSISSGKIISKKVISYAAETDYEEVSTVFINDVLVRKFWYNINGEVIQMKIREDENEVMTRVAESIEEETGYKVVEKTTTITKANGTFITHVCKSVYDENNNLLSYAEDNSKVTAYTYDDQNRRSTAVTKQLVDDRFIVIDEIAYSYETDSETGKTTKTRTEVRYDKDGNQTNKFIITENFDGELRYGWSHENRTYEVPSNSTP